MGLFDDIGKQVSDTWSDVTKTGVPAVVAGAESYASQVLADQAKANQAQAAVATQAVVNQPGHSTGIMASIQKSLSQIGQDVGLKEYGGYLLIGIAGLIALGLVLKE